MSKKLSLEYVQKIFSDKDCELLSTMYINTGSKLSFKCKCGRLDEKSLDAFKARSACKYCNTESSVLCRTTPYSFVVNLFESNHCKLLTTKQEYKNKRDKVNFICKCGRQSNKTIKAFIETKMCNACIKDKQSLDQTYDYYYIQSIVNSKKCELITPFNDTINAQSDIDIQCKCNEIFTTKFIRFIHENKQQCNKCGIATRSKEFSPRWKGGCISEDEQIRKSIEYNQWRKMVYKRDNYTCQCCGDDIGGNLQAHHLQNFSSHPELRLDVTNGIVLCNLCHNFNQYGSFHYIYGAINNTPEQLQEYIQRYKNGEFNEIRLKNVI